MAARSVAEILPKRFEELDLSDVEEILHRVAEERESVFFERKAIARGDLLAKSCSAFANTMGGLLIVGVPDDSDELVGITDKIAEPQLWVKDLLRGKVLPVPPFRARRVDLDKRRWILLVLVEESSTTPHFTNKGAIYVRNGSSSEPVPVAEQRTLFELIERGKVAEQRAVDRGFKLVGTRPERSMLLYTLAMVPTGITGDALRRAELLDPELGRLVEVLGLDDRPPAFAETWHQEFVEVRADVQPPLLASGAVLPAKVLLATLHRDGAMVVHVGVPEDERPAGLELAELRVWFLKTLDLARDLLLDLGAHGDLRIALRLVGGYGHLMYAPSRGRPLTSDATVGKWTALDPDEGADAAVLDELTAELLRTVGIRPADRTHA